MPNQVTSSHSGVSHVACGTVHHSGPPNRALPGRSLCFEVGNLKFQSTRPESFVLEPSRSTAQNRLLATLSRQDRQRLLAKCQQVQLIFADVLYKPSERIRHVF